MIKSEFIWLDHQETYDSRENQVNLWIYKQSKTKGRKKGDIGFSVTRGGEIAGEHTVSFIGQNDRIDLTHKASNRSIFVSGAIVAAIFVSKKKKGLFNMQDLF